MLRYQIHSAGQAALASEVNANLTDVDQKTLTNTTDIQTNAGDIQTNTDSIVTNTDAIAAIPLITVYDYRDFIADSNITSKTFATTGLCGDTEVRTIANSSNGANTDVVVTRRRLNAG